MTTIDWSKIPAEYRWVAMDRAGMWFGYTHEPNKGDAVWHSINDDIYVITLDKSDTDWTTSLQKRPEENEMTDIELAVGQIYESESGEARREIVAIYAGDVAYKANLLAGEQYCGVADREDFGELAHKLVDSLEFPKPKKTVKKSQCVLKRQDTNEHHLSEKLFSSKEETEKYFEYAIFSIVQWPLVVNGVEQWVEVETND
jgi:hypothetical protein